MKITIISAALMALLIFFPTNAKGSEFATTINTFLPWETQTDKTLQVSIIKETVLSADEIESVKKAITGDGSIKFDDKTTYVGWQEALKRTAGQQTKTPMPSAIEIVADNNKEADITITLTDAKNENGYSGYTTYVIEDSKIVKSNITIYEIKSLTSEQISSITRHEFGHGLGIAHAESPDDLMYEIVQVPSYVSDCDVDTLLSLYDDNALSFAECSV